MSRKIVIEIDDETLAQEFLDELKCWVEDFFDNETWKINISEILESEN